MGLYIGLAEEQNKSIFLPPPLYKLRIRVGLSKRGYAFAREKMADWLQDLGLELRDEQPGHQMTGVAASCVPVGSSTP